MSLSVPMVPPRGSFDCQTATQLPVAFVATWGAMSSPPSVTALVLRGIGVLQVAPSSEE